jgi:hypothetical protein
VGVFPATEDLKLQKLSLYGVIPLTPKGFHIQKQSKVKLEWPIEKNVDLPPSMDCITVMVFPFLSLLPLTSFRSLRGRPETVM